jgi:MFS family permease
MEQREQLILVLLSLAQLMIVLDFSIVNVALPSIQSQFPARTHQTAMGGECIRDHLRELGW